MARDRPSPSGERETVLTTVARGPVPRECSICAKTARHGRFLDRGTARDRPSPSGERETVLTTVARGPVPRDRPICAKTARQGRFLNRGPARDRPSPYGDENPSWPVARGPVPRECSLCAKTARQPRLSPRPRHGEGQALALREGEAFFIVARGASDATRASERVSTATLNKL